jgi:hypothetical protein
MKRIAMMLVLTLTATIAVASFAMAQAPAPKPAPEGAAKPEAKAAALPTLDEVLAKYVKASGGEEAIKKVSSRTMKGTFELPAMGASGTVEMVTKAPNMNYMKIEIGGFGTIVSVFDGKAAWSQDPMSGLRELSGVELAQMKLQSDFHRELRMKELYKSLTVKSREKLAGGSAIMVEAIPAEGSPEKYYFDETSGLLVRHDSEPESPQGKMPTESTLEDYKMVDGVNIAHTMKQTTPAFAMTIKIEEVKNNVAVETTKFSKPAAQ